MGNSYFIRLKKISQDSGIGTATLRSYIRKGLLHGILIGGNYYVSQIDYDKFLYKLYANSLNLDPDKFSDAFSKLREEDRNKAMDYFYNNRSTIKQD